MSTAPNRPDDPHSRVNYRRLVAWETRITRKGPFPRSLRDRAPDRSGVDLGCRTEEHVAFFARERVRAVGLDRSEAMVSAGKDYEKAGHGRFVLGDAVEADVALGDGSPFDLLLCLGNRLPQLYDETDLTRFLSSVHDILRPGGLLLLRCSTTKGCSRPANTRCLSTCPGDDGKEILFLRLMSR